MISKDKERLILTLPKHIIREIEFEADELSITKSDYVFSLLCSLFDEEHVEYTTILVIRDKTGNDIFLSEFASYELAAAHASTFFDDVNYIWLYFEKKKLINGNILLDYFCTCQGGQKND